MISGADATVLAVLWLAYGLFVAVAVGAAVWWAKHTGQFRDQDRARYLPLDAEIPEEDELQEDKNHV